MSADNPWLAVPPPPAEQERTAAVVRPPAIAPQPESGVPLPPPHAQLRVRAHNHPAELWCLGAHGGAGETTLTTLLPGSRQAGHAWPLHLDLTAANTVLLARTNAAGIQAAQHAAQHWAAGALPGVNLIGLVWMPDIPAKLPRGLRERAELVSGGLPRTWWAPWIDQLREDPHPDPAVMSRPLRQLLTEIVDTLEGPTR